MKKILLLILLNVFFSVIYAEQESIVLRDPRHQHDHYEYYPPADMPEAVYYDTDAEEIVIEGDGMFTSYYNVLIIRNSTNQTVISTQISGYGDSIDVSALPSDNYTLVITTESNNVFEGEFTIQ